MAFGWVGQSGKVAERRWGKGVGDFMLTYRDSLIKLKYFAICLENITMHKSVYAYTMYSGCHFSSKHFIKTINII